MNYKEFKMWKNIWIASFIFLFVSAVCVLVYHGINYYTENKEENTIESNIQDEETELDKAYKLLKEIEQYYKTSYVGELDTEKLELNLANALVQSYGDKYGVYLTPELAEDDKNTMNNILYGIGVLVRAELNNGSSELYVVDSYDGSSALENGIVKGCRIVEIEGAKFDFTKETYADVVNKIKGDEGTYVNITFIDNKNNIHECKVERRKINIKTVDYKILNNIGYINIREFDANTDEEFEKALKYMKDNKIEKIIYDLRDNTGGLLESVVNMLDNLLPETTFLYIQDSNNNILQTFKSDKDMYTFKSVCIINNNTASASELFVQTLKEQGITTVIGETSFGKGTVCNVIDLSNGGTLQISTFKYLTISKECIEGVGVKPDIEMKLPEEKEAIQYKLDISDDDIINNAIKILE